MKSSRVLVAALLGLSMAAAAAPAVVTQEATGESAIVNGDQKGAEDRAKAQALRAAVEQVAGVMVSSDTLTKNSQLVSDRIYSNSAGYVRKYDVISKKAEGGVMKVTVRADVGASDIDKDLQAVIALVHRFGSPKLVIILQEQAIDPSGVVSSSGVMSTVLTDGFKRDGWTIIDPHFAAGKLRLAPGVSLGAGEVKEIGDLSKAEYVLYGTVNFRYQAPITTGMVPEKDQNGQQLVFNVTGEYDLSVFATDSGSQLTKISGKFNTGDMGRKGSQIISYERTSFDISKGKGEAIVAEMRKTVLDYLRSAEQNGNRLVMHVNGLPEYAAVKNFRRVLEDVSGMKNVTQKPFQGGKAEYELSYVGTTDELADKLSAKNFKGKKISVTAVSGNTMELTLAK